MGICSIAVVKNVHYKPRKIQNGYNEHEVKFVITNGIEGYNEQYKSKRQSKLYYVEKAYS